MVEWKRCIIFTRYPEPGRTKTRLIPAVGEVGAADLQRRMTERMVERALAWSAGGEARSVQVCFEGGSVKSMARWMEHAFGDQAKLIGLRPQSSGDLGEKMERALDEAFEQNCTKALVVGTDCPTIDAGVLGEAFERLGEVDVVLGPASDGGYYLLGLSRRPERGLFEGMEWGGPTVLSATLDSIERLAWRKALLAERIDVDRPEDLGAWRAAGGTEPESVSVVIPTLNEAGHIDKALEALRVADRVECIVSDGGSSDATVKLAQECGALVVESRKGRGTQMNAGAGEASHSILLFLHADTTLPEAWDDWVRLTLGLGASLGAFELEIDGPGMGYRWLEGWVRRRSRWFGLPYGDQGFFMEKSLFQALGGFADISIMEDVDLAMRVRRRGRQGIVPRAVKTSSRRWEEQGWWRVSMRNHICLAGHLSGVSPSRIYRWYYGRGL